MPELMMGEGYLKGREYGRRSFLDMRKYQIQKAAQKRQSILDERKFKSQQSALSRQSMLDERKFKRQQRLDVMGSEKFGLEKGLLKQKLATGRARIEREGAVDALGRLMAGDREGAIRLYNNIGEHRVTDAQYDQATGLATITDDQGRSSEINARQFLENFGDLPRQTAGRDIPFPKDVESQKIRMDAAKRKGRGETTVTIGPEGAIVVSPGTDIRAPRGAKASMFKDAVASQTALETYDRIDSLYDDEFLTYKGSAKGAWATFLNKLDPDERSNFQYRRSRFLSEVGREFLTFRKWATGVAGSEKEMAEIKRITFSEDDSPQDFEAKIKTARDVAQRLNARIKAALVAGIDNDKKYKEYIKKNPLDSIPSISDRGEELLKYGYSESLVEEILKTEGY